MRHIMRYFKNIYLTLPFLLLLNGCSASHSNSWLDPIYEEKMQTANELFQAHHAKEAIKFYQEASQEAFLANMPQAIHDSGFNLALSYDAAHEEDHALLTIANTEESLKERQNIIKTNNADLTLLKGFIFYHQKDWEHANNNAQEALQESAQDTTQKNIQSQAIYLQGLIAFEQGDTEKLINNFSQYSAFSHINKINLLELTLDKEILTHQWEQANQDADRLIKLRRQQQNYHAMRRALARKIMILHALGKNDDADNITTQIQDSLKNKRSSG